MPATTGAFADLLDPRFRRIHDNEYKQLPDMIDTFYPVETGKQLTERNSSIGTFGDMGQFTGTVAYDDVYQGYDTTSIHLEFAQGFQVERLLFEFDQFRIMDGKPRGLAQSLWRRRQTDAARPFNNAFSVDTFFSTNTEGVAMCSNSHTTTSGASTTTGFDNNVTTGLSYTALTSARILMWDFRGDRAERINVNPDTLVVPINLDTEAFETIQSEGKPDTANNNASALFKQLKIIRWNYLSDTNNWFMIDSNAMKSWGLIWYDKIKGEFAMIEDFDTLIGKWRDYGVWTNGWLNWRFCLGGNVS